MPGTLVFCQEKELNQRATGNVSKETLLWKAFRPQAVFYQELVTSTTQEMLIMGQEIRQKQTQTFYLKWTAGAKTTEGNHVVTLAIIGLKMNINIGGNTISYDSTEDKQPQNPMSDFFKALLGMKLKLTISPQMEVVNIEGPEQFIQKQRQRQSADDDTATKEHPRQGRSPANG